MKPGHERVDESTATFRLSALERDAAEAVVAGSQQAHVKLLPNHHMNSMLELAGFHFSCNASDLASVMPLPRTLFACSAMYEVRSAEGAQFNASVLRVLGEESEARAALAGVVATLARVRERARFRLHRGRGRGSAGRRRAVVSGALSQRQARVG